MPGVLEAAFEAVGDGNRASVPHAAEQGKGRLRVLDRVERSDRWQSFPTVAFVDELRVPLLNVRAVEQHHLAETLRGLGAMDGSAESLAHQPGEVPAVINVRVGEDNGLECCGIKRKLAVADPGFLPRTVIDAAVEQDRLSGHREHVHGAGDRAGGALKLKVHEVGPKKGRNVFSGYTIDR